MSTLNVQSITDGTNTFTVDDNIKGTAQAWVNFDSVGGSITIHKSYNISSITDLGTGKFTVVFSTPMADNDYCVIASVAKDDGNDDFNQVVTIGNTVRVPTTTGFPLSVGRSREDNAVDSQNIYAVVYTL